MQPSISVQDVFNSTSNGVIATDGDGNIILCNPKSRRILGINNKHTIGADICSILPSMGEHTHNCLQTGKPLIGHHTQDNKVSLVINITPIRKRGTIAGTVINFQKMRQFEHSAQKLGSYQHLLDQLEAVFSSSSDGLVILDRNGKFVRMNHASQQLNGWKEKDIIGKNSYKLVDRGIVSKSATMEVLRKKCRVSVMQFIKTTQKYLLVTGTPVFDENGDISLVVLNERDLTQLNAIREQLEQTRQIAEKYKDELVELSMLELENQDIIAKSQPMKQVLRIGLKLARLAASNILILGESGTGKGLLSKYIHHNSKRRRKPFIQINCAALPENLLEAELFGYEKGAFTGAQEKGKAGLFELAQGGTLFLDEIGELPLPIQAKLLKYLDDNIIMPLGGTKTISIDCTIIAATNRDLEALVRNGKFRKDLYYRLNIFSLTIPPLRERQDDIFDMTTHFLKRYNKEYRLQKRIFSKGIRALQYHAFPGNVRELMNVVRKAVVLSEAQNLDPLIEQILNESYTPDGKTKIASVPIKSLKDELLKVEKEIIKGAMSRCKTTYELAGILGISQPTAHRKLSKHGL